MRVLPQMSIELSPSPYQDLLLLSEDGVWPWSFVSEWRDRHQPSLRISSSGAGQARVSAT
jgi:hypothetical protein